MRSTRKIRSCEPAERALIRHAIEQGLHLVGGPFLDQKCQNDTNRFLRNISIDADISDESPDKLVHGPTPSPH